jgi:hypothetical protein
MFKGKRAVCITIGEQSENHVGMAKQGDGLAETGYSVDHLMDIKTAFESIGGVADMVNLNNGLTDAVLSDDVYVEGACVLVMRDCVGRIFSHRKESASDVFNEMMSFEWDKKYWDVRRSKWLNKLARYNVCFGAESKGVNEDEKSGTIIGYDKCPLLKKCKDYLERICGEGKTASLECEGNLYYDLSKTGIGFHGDGERKKVIAMNLCDEGVEREIHWQWYVDYKPVGERTKVVLRNGDCYVMSEKASGFDWKRRVKIVDGKKKKLATLRHAAGVSGSKYLK